MFQRILNNFQVENYLQLLLLWIYVLFLELYTEIYFLEQYLRVYQSIRTDSGMLTIPLNHNQIVETIISMKKIYFTGIYFSINQNRLTLDKRI